MEDGRPRLSSHHSSPASSPSRATPSSSSPSWSPSPPGTGSGPPIVAAVHDPPPPRRSSLRNVRRGVWSDHDVSRRDQRGGLYRAALPLLALSALLLCLLDAGPRHDARLRRRRRDAPPRPPRQPLPEDLHAHDGRRLLRRDHRPALPATAFAIVPFVAAIAWSRRKLERHTWTEIVVGLAIGGAAAWFAAMWSRRVSRSHSRRGPRFLPPFLNATLPL